MQENFLVMPPNQIDKRSDLLLQVSDKYRRPEQRLIQRFRDRCSRHDKQRFDKDCVLQENYLESTSQHR